MQRGSQGNRQQSGGGELGLGLSKRALSPMSASGAPAKLPHVGVSHVIAPEATESRVLLIAKTILLTASGAQLSPSCRWHVGFGAQGGASSGAAEQLGSRAANLHNGGVVPQRTKLQQRRPQPAAWHGSLPPAQTWAVTVGAGCGGGAGCAAVSSCPALREAVRVSSRSMI